MRYEDLPRDELVRICQRLDERLAETEGQLALAEVRHKALLRMAAKGES